MKRLKLLLLTALVGGFFVSGPAFSQTTDRLDGIQTGLAVKAPVKAASTGNLTLSGHQTVGGVALVSGDRVLVKDQTNAAQNGIYNVNTGTWQRAADFDGNRDVVDGTLVVLRNASDDDQFYQVSATDPVIIGSSEIQFELTSLGVAGLRNDLLSTDDGKGFNLVSYTVTSSEISAGVTVLNAQYQPGHIYRYGINVTPGTTDMTAAIQASFDSSPVATFPEGIFLVSDTLRPRSNQIINGAGRPEVVPNAYPAAPTITGGTLIRMAPTVGRNTNAMQIGTRDAPSNNVTISDLGVDFNRARWDVSGGTFDGEDMHSTAIGIYGSENVRLDRVAGIDGYKHSIDISAPSYQRGHGNATTYDPQPSRYVWLNEAYATGAGDDNITTHHSSFIWVNDSVSEYPSGVRVPSNSNCLEVDDGSRNVFINNHLSRGGVRGLEVKGHSDSPAPYNVHVNGYRGINNARGLEVRHLGHQSVSNSDITAVNQGTPSFTISGDQTDFFAAAEEIVISGSTGNDGMYTTVLIELDGGDTVITVLEAIPSAVADGAIIQNESPTAYDLFLDDITIVAPKRDTTYSVISNIARHPIVLKAYARVKFGKVLLTDGSNDLDNLEFEETDMDSSAGSIVRMFLHARDVSFEELHIDGFPTLTRGFLATASTPGGIYIGRLVGRNAPGAIEFFRTTSNVTNVRVMSYEVSGAHGETAGSVGIRISGSVTPDHQTYLGPGTVTGYETPVIFNGASQVSGSVGLSSLLVSASTTAGATLNITHGTAPTSPRDGDIWTTDAGIFARIDGVTVQLAVVP